MGPIWAQLDPKEPNIDPTWAQLGPIGSKWARMGLIGPNQHGPKLGPDISCGVLFGGGGWEPKQTRHRKYVYTRRIDVIRKKNKKHVK